MYELEAIAWHFLPGKELSERKKVFGLKKAAECVALNAFLSWGTNVVEYFII